MHDWRKSYTAVRRFLQSLDFVKLGYCASVVRVSIVTSSSSSEMTDCNRLISNGSSAGIGMTAKAAVVTLACFWEVPPCALRLRFADLDCVIVMVVYLYKVAYDALFNY